jgi:hypothetical protein
MKKKKKEIKDILHRGRYYKIYKSSLRYSGYVEGMKIKE